MNFLMNEMDSLSSLVVESEAGREVSHAYRAFRTWTSSLSHFLENGDDLLEGGSLSGILVHADMD